MKRFDGILDGVKAVKKRYLPLARLRSALTTCCMAVLVYSPAMAGPEGGVIVRGNGSINQQTPGHTIIDQRSRSMVADWQSFNVAPSELVRFVQPGADAVALNRILDQNPSQILGMIDANGRVFLANPNGIVFGKTAQVNVGSLVATSLRIDPDDFMTGNYRLGGGNGGGAVVNLGRIEVTPGGSVSLVGGEVSNEGTILAELGQVNLAAGKAAVLDFDGDRLLGVRIEEGIDANRGGDAAVSNSGEILARGGTVSLSASATRNVYNNLVNNSGLVSATRIDASGGDIRLVGSGPGGVVNTGTLDVSGNAAGVTGGTVAVTGSTVHVDGTIDASGPAGGGEILVGGDYQGKGELANARNTSIGAGADLRADATSSGDGGRVIVWSDHTTTVDGNISARGGPVAGDGGFVETSGKINLDFSTSVDVSAPAGNGGEWLLDPTNININRARANDIEETLNAGGNVTIQTVAEGDEDGNITVNARIDKTGGADASLTLDAHGNVDVNRPITSTSGKLDVNLKAGRSINVNSAITTNGGMLTTMLMAAATEPPGGEGEEGGGEEPEVPPEGEGAGEEPSAPTESVNIAANVITSGGNVSIDAGTQRADIRADVDTSSESGTGGGVQVTGQEIALSEAARVNSSGLTGGGNILIGTNSTSGPAEGVTGRSVSIQGSALSSNATDNGNAGSIVVWANESTEFRGTVNAAGGIAGGNGGQVEISATELVNLGESTFEVSSIAGTRGSVLIDPVDLTISGNQLANGDLTLTADNSITVDSNVLISTRNVGVGGDHVVGASLGDSGNLVVRAPNITVNSGGQLLAHADSTFLSGDVNLDASISDTRFSTEDNRTVTDNGISEVGARIQLDDTSIRGNNVTIRASAESAVDYNDQTLYADGQEFTDVTSLLEPRLGTFGDDTIMGGAAVARSTAEVAISGGRIQSEGNTSIDAEAKASVYFGSIEDPDNPGERLQEFGEALAVAYGETRTVATVDINNDAVLESGGAIEVRSNTGNTTVVKTGALRTARTRPTGLDRTYDATLAVAETQSTSRASIDGSVTTTAVADLGVGATSDRSTLLSSTANHFVDGTLRQAVGLSFADNTTTAALGGSVNADNVTVTANATSSSATTGVLSGFRGQANDIFNKTDPTVVGGRQASQDVLEEINRFFVGEAIGIDLRVDPTGLDAVSTAVGGPDLTDEATARLLRHQVPGAQGFSDHSLVANADILADAIVTSNGAVTVEANTRDEDVQHFAHTRIVRHTGGSTTSRDQDATRNVALIVSNHDNSANAGIGEGASVDAGGQIAVTADARFPNAGIDWPEMPDLTDLTNLELSLDTLSETGEIKEEFAEFREDLVNEGDILAGLVTTSAKAHGLKNGTDERLGIAGSANILNIGNVANAIVGDNVRINQGSASAAPDQNLMLTANALVETVNLTGNVGALPEGTTKKSFLGVDRESRDTTGVGSSYHDFNLVNNAAAKVGNGALVNVDELNVDSNAEFSNLSLTISSGPAEKYGVKGAVSLTDVDSDSVAQVRDGATVTARDVSLSANNSTVRDPVDPINGLLRGNINIAVANLEDATRPSGGYGGGSTVPTSDRIAGAISVNDMDRRAVAVIGVLEDETASAGSVHADNVTLEATSSGDIRSYTASILQQGNSSGNTGGGTSIYGSPSGYRGYGQGNGLNVSADVSWNSVTDDTIAGINGAASVNTPGNVNLGASNDSGIFALAGSVTRSRNSGGGFTSSQNANNTGLVGAFTRNIVNGATSANITGASVTAGGNVNLEATRTSEIFAIAAGGSNSPDTDLVGSVALNTIGENLIAFDPVGGIDLSTDPLVIDPVVIDPIVIDPADIVIDPFGIPQEFFFTEARITDADVDVTGDLDLSASDTSDIFAVGGAAQSTSDSSMMRRVGRHQYNNEGGVGAGLSINDIGNNTLTRVENSQVDVSGQLRLDTGSLASIDAVAASIMRGSQDLVGGALTWNEIGNNVTATIEGGNGTARTVNAAGVTLDAHDTSRIRSVAGAIASNSGGSAPANPNVAIGVSVAYNQIDNTIAAGISDATVITTGALDIDATNAADIQTLVAGYTNSSGDGATGSVAINRITTATDAYITAGSVIDAGGNVDLLADADNTIQMLAATIASNGDPQGGMGGTVGGGGLGSLGARNGQGQYFGVGISGDVAINMIADDTSARIDAESVVNSGGDVSLAADNHSDIDTIAGAIEKTNDPSGTGIAGSFGDARIDGNASAVVDSAEVNAAGDLALAATRSGEIFNIAGSVATGGALDLAGAVSSNEIGNSTIARIRESDVVAANVDLDARDEANIFSIGGAAVNQGGSQPNPYASGREARGGVGAGIAINAIGNETLAEIDNSDIATGSVDADAVVTGKIETIAGSIANGTDNMLSGAVAWNEINNVTRAEIRQDAIAANAVNAAGNVTLGASDTSIIGAIAGQVTKTESSAIGASLAYNQIGNQVGAGIRIADVNAAAFAADAESDAAIQALVVGLGLAESDGITASIAINEISSATDAYVTDGSRLLTTAGDALLLANSIGEIQMLAFTYSSAGGGSSSSGGGAYGGGMPTSPAGGQGTNFGIGVSGDVAINTIDDATTARIDEGSDVDSAAGVTLVATSDNDIDVIAGAVQNSRSSGANNPGGGSPTGIAGAYAEANIGGVTAARVAHATVTARDDLDLRAARSGDIFSIAASVSSGGGSNIAGSVSHNRFDSETSAIIERSDVEVANVDLDAVDGSGVFAIGGAAVNQSGSNSSVAGGRGVRGGLGAGIAINVLDNQVTSAIDDSQVETGAISLDAASNGEIQAIAGAIGRGSDNMLTGAVAWNENGNTVESRIRRGAGNSTTVNTTGPVSLNATDTASIQSLAGQISKTDSSAIGASVAYNQVDGGATALLDNAELLVDGAVSASAGASHTIETLVGGLVLAGGDNVSASVAINDIGGHAHALVGNGSSVDAESLSLHADADNDIDVLSFSIASGSPDNGGGPSGGSFAGNPLGASGGQGTNFGLNISGDVVLNEVHKTTVAEIGGGSNVNTPGNTTLLAENDSDILAIGGAFQAGGNTGQSAAGAYARSEINDVTRASVDGATLQAGGGLDLEARHGGQIISAAVGGAKGGQNNLAGSVSHNVVGGETAALIDGATTIAGGDTTLTATDEFDIIGIGGALSFGGANAGLGAGIALNDVDSTTRARVGESDVLAGGALTLGAWSLGDIHAVAAAVARNPNSIAGAVSVNTIGNTTEAELVDNTNTVIASSVSLDARNDAGIHSLAGSVGLGSNLGVGGAGSYNRVANTTRARVTGTDIDTTGVVDINAANIAQIETLAGGVAVAGNAVSVSVAVNEMDSDTSALVTGGSQITNAGQVNVDATNNSTIDALAVSVAVSGISVGGGQSGGGQSSSQGNFGLGVSGDVVISDIEDDTLAAIDAGSELVEVGDARVEARNDSSITAIAGAVAIGTGSNDNSIAGAYVQNNIGGRTAAEVRDASVDAQSLDVIARSGTPAGLLTPSGDPSSPNRIVGIAAGGTLATGSGGANGLAGSVANSRITGATEAQVVDSDVRTESDINVEATTDAEIIGVGGAISVALGNGGGYGAGLSINEVESVTAARVTDSRVDAGGALSVEAENNSDIWAVAGAIGVGASSGGNGGAGSFSFNQVNNETSAEISGGRDVDTVRAADEIAVSATDDSAIHSLSGAIGVAGNVALGISAAYNEIGNVTRAGISNADVASTGGSVAVDADSDNFVETLVAGVAASNAIAASGSAAISQFAGETDAYISNSQVAADDNLLVRADADNDLDELAVGLAASAGSAGVGGAVAVNIFDNVTRARIDTDSVVEAHANGDSALINTGALGGTTLGGAPTALAAQGNVGAMESPGQLDLDDSQIDTSPTNVYELNKVLGARQAEAIRGVGVSAVSSDSINTIDAYAAGSTGAVAVGGAVTVNVLNSEVNAVIADSAVNQSAAAGGAEQAVRVNAGNHTVANTYGGALAGSTGGVGVGVTGSVNVNDKVTRAGIVRSAVDANGSVGVRADSSNEFGSLMIGVGVGSNVGVAASAGVLVSESTTEAYLTDTTVNTGGDVAVAARERTNVDLLSGGISGAGTAAVGVAANVVTTNNTVRARIDGDSTVNSSGALGVRADNVVQLFDIAAAGGGAGTVAAQGGIGVKVVENTTEAYIGDNVDINQDDSYASANQDVTVAATDTMQLFSVDAALGIGGVVGVGAGVDVNVVNNSTNAWIGDNASVSAGRDILVLADSAKDVTSVTVGVGGAGKVGVGGAVSVVVIGGAIDGEQETALQMVRNGKDENGDDIPEEEKENYDINNLDQDFLGNPVNGDGGQNLLVVNEGSPTSARDQFAGQAYASLTSTTAGNGVTSKFSASTPAPESGTHAWIGGDAVIDAGRDVNVSADNTTDTFVFSGGVGVGGIAGVGAGVGVVSVTDHTTAHSGVGSVINAGNDVTIRATDGHDPALAPSRVYAAAGGGGIVGIGAAVAVQNRSSTTEAYLASGARIDTANDVLIEADQEHYLDSQIVNIAVGGVAVGGSYSQADSRATVSAHTGIGSRIGAPPAGAGGVDNVSVVATSTQDVQANTIAVTGGLVGVTGSGTASYVESDVDALIGEESVIRAEEDIAVDAHADSTSVAVVSNEGDDPAIGLSIGGVAVNVNITDASSLTNVDAAVDGGADLAGRDLLVEATEIGEVTARTLSGGGGIGSVQGAGGYAYADSTINAEVLDDAIVTLTGDAEIVADSELDVYAEAIAAGGGGLSINGNGVEAVSVSRVNARLGQATLGAESLAVTANRANASGDANHAVTGNSISGGGGVVSVNGGGVLVDATAEITSEIADDAIVNVDDALAVTARGIQDAQADVSSAGGGGVSVNAALATVDADDTVNARIGQGAEVDAGSVAVDAIGINRANPGSSLDDVTVLSAGGGVLSGNGGGGEVNATATVNAVIDDSATVNATGPVEVTADGTQLVNLFSNTSGAGGISINAGTGTTTSTLTVLGRVGEQASIDAGSLLVDADGDNRVNVNMESSGGGAISGNGAGGNAIATGNVTAEVDDDAEVIADAAVTVSSDLFQRANTVVNSAGGGAISVNAGAGGANSNATSLARIGEDVAVQAGSLLVDADSDNAASMDMSSAGGGGISINAGGVTAHATSDTDAIIADNSDDDVLIDVDGAVEVLAEAHQVANTQVTSPGGGLVSVNQSAANVNATMNVDASVGAGINLDAGSLTVNALAYNDANPGQDINNPTARAEGGGIVGVNTSSANVVASVSANAAIGDDAEITVTDRAEVSTEATQVARIAVVNAGGGAVSVNVGGASATSDLSTSATLGDDVVLSARNFAVEARGDNTYRADSRTTGGGAISVNSGGVSATGTTTVVAETGADNTIATAENMRVEAEADSEVDVESVSTGGGVIEVSTAAAVAEADVTARAVIGTNNTVTNGGTLRVLADGDSDVRARSDVDNGGFVAVGVSNTRGTSIVDVDAKIDDDSTVVTGSDITLLAAGRHVVDVDSEANNGGFVAVADSGGEDSRIQATGTLLLNAETGDDVTLQAGNILLKARANVDENGNAIAGKGVFADTNVSANGFVGASGSRVRALTSPTVVAGFGDRNSITATGNVDVIAQRHAVADSSATGQAGGAGAGGSVSTESVIGGQTIEYPVVTVNYPVPQFTPEGDRLYAVGDGSSYYVDVDDVGGESLYRYEQIFIGPGYYVPYTDPEGRIYPLGEDSPLGAPAVEYLVAAVDFDGTVYDVMLVEDGTVLGAYVLEGPEAGRTFEAGIEVDGANINIIVDDAPTELDSDFGEITYIANWNTPGNISLVRIEGGPPPSNLVAVTDMVEFARTDFDNPTVLGEAGGQVNASAGDNTRIVSGGNINFDAYGSARGEATGTGSGYGAVAGYGARATTDITTDVDAGIGEGTTLVAQSQDGGSANVTIRATTAVQGDSDADSTAGAFAIPSVVPYSRVDINSTNDVNVGTNAAVSADDVLLDSRTTQLRAYSDAYAHVNGFGSGITVDAISDVDSDTRVNVEAGSRLTGRNQVDLIARLDDIADGVDGRIESRTHKGGSVAFDTGTQNAKTVADLDTLVDFEDTAEIHTYDVNFESVISSATQVRAVSDTNSGLIDPNTFGWSSSANAYNRIDGTIVMLDSVGQELLIHADGRIETISGEITASYDAAGNIVVDDLVKDQVGRVRIYSPAPAYSYDFEDGVGITASHEERNGVSNPNGYALNQGTLQYSNIFPYVKIVNLTDANLEIGRIILADPGSALPEFLINAENQAGPAIGDYSANRNGAVNFFNRLNDYSTDPATVFGGTNGAGAGALNMLTITQAEGDRRIQIFGEGTGNITFTDLVDSEENVEGNAGSVFVSSVGGDILSSGSAAIIETHDFDGRAYDGSIGTSGDYLTLNLFPDGVIDAVVDAFAHGNIFLDLAPLAGSSGGVDIGDVIASGDLRLGLGNATDGGAANYEINGDVAGLSSVDIQVADNAALNITGNVQSGIENYFIDIDADGNVTVDISNIGVDIDRILPDGNTVNLAYGDGDWAGFVPVTVGNTIIIPDIVHRPGTIVIEGPEPASGWLTGDGTLSALGGYSHVEINNDSAFDLQLGLIDIDTAPETQIRINSDTDVQTDEYDSIDVVELGNAEGLIAVDASQDTDVTLAGNLLNSSGLTDIDVVGNILQPSGSHVVRSREIDLATADGNIGADDAPVRIDLQGGNLNALLNTDADTTGGSARVEEIDGDLNLELAGGIPPDAVNGNVTLIADGSIVDSNGADLNILANNVILEAGANIDTDLWSLGYVDAIAPNGFVDLDSFGFTAATPRDIALRNVTAGFDLDVNAANITDVEGSSLLVTGNAEFDSNGNDIVLGDQPADDVRFGSLTFTGDTVDISEDDDMLLAGANTAATLRLRSDGSITDDPAASLLVTGDSDLGAVADIVLDNVVNDYQGRVDSDAVNTTLVDANSILLGDSVTTGDFNVTALDGTITDVGAASIGGTTNLLATGDIILDTRANDFMGEVNSDGVTITLADANDIALGTTVADGDLNVTSVDGHISDTETGSGALVAGTTNLLAETVDGIDTASVTDRGDIVLDNVLNDFQGEVNSDGEDIVLVDANDIALGTSVADGDLDVTSKDGHITDTETGAGALVTGATYLLAETVDGIDAGAYTDKGDITLDNVLNDFMGSVNSDGEDIALVDTNDIDLGTTNAQGGLRVHAISGGITDSGTATVNLPTYLLAATDISLDTETNDFRAEVNSNGVNITLVDANDILLETTVASGDLSVRAIDGFIADTGSDGWSANNIGRPATSEDLVAVPLIGEAPGYIHNDGALVAGETRLRARSLGAGGRRTDTGDIVLDNPLNDFQGTVFANGEDITLVDENDIELGITRASGGLNVKSITGDITDVGNAVVNLVTNLIAEHDIVLDTRSNDFRGVVNSDGVNITLVDANDIVLGTTTARGDLDVEAITGAITDVGTATVDGTTTLLASNVITLDTRSNDFRGPVHSDGLNIHLVDINDIALGNTISRRSLRVEAITGGISDIPGARISVPMLGDFQARNDIILGDVSSDSTNFGDLTVNGRHAIIQEDSGTNFANASNVQSLEILSYGDITDTGTVNVAGNSLIRVSNGNSIYLDSEFSTYYGNVTIGSPNGLVNNLRFVDATPLALGNINTTGWIDIAALGNLSTTGRISAAGDISLNAYGALSLGGSGIYGQGEVNLAAVDGGFGPGAVGGARTINIGTTIQSARDRVSLLAGDNIAGSGVIITPADASLWSSRGRIGNPGGPVRFNIGGDVSIYQAELVAYITGNYRAANAWVFPSGFARGLDISQFFDGLFFRGLPDLSSDLFIPGIIHDPAYRDIAGGSVVGRIDPSWFEIRPEEDHCNGVSLYEQNDECMPVDEESIIDIEPDLIIDNQEPRELDGDKLSSL